MRKELMQRAMKVCNSQLRQHNAQLRKNLKRVVGYSTDNEDIQLRIDEMDDLVFKSENLKEMFDILLVQGRRIFKIDFISIVLPVSMKELYPEHYKEEDGSVHTESENIRFVDIQRLCSTFQNINEPILRGSMRMGDTLFFSHKAVGKIRSEGLVPLSDGESLTGAIGFASMNPERFGEGYGVRFVKRLARTISLKMELFRANALVNK